MQELTKLKEIVRHELIGLKVLVYKSKNKYQEGLKGVVIDETYSMLIIQTKKGIKKIYKGNCWFIFEFKGYKVKVDGKLLIGRPADRVKKKLPC
ncbi:MAG: ribonuclease P protein subunit [Candidatus Aenigmarchaeota archaeon]|nr:ribonuclease P protein subunit [Candidatus Aenigmarchaeota archaeon]MDW8149494.1 ribonuclease P protein subunit [Candidatus Aenigmarchaeota archaeon]